MDGTRVELNYRVVIENIGNISGYAEQIGFYLGSGMQFKEENNPDWYIGEDGIIYSQKVKDLLLTPGDKARLEIELTKEIEGTEAEIIQNKAVLIQSYGQLNVKEDTNENVGVQNTFISISTGKARNIIISTAIEAIIVLGIYLHKKGMINLSVININFDSDKKKYKGSESTKKRGKKIYR